MDKKLSVDLKKYHHGLGYPDAFFSKTQPTWTKLIQVLLEIKDINSLSVETRRLFQSQKLGNEKGNHCLLELMPLASPSTNNDKWIWQEVFTQYFGTLNRNEYFLHTVQKRREGLKELIYEYKPKLVLFYSTLPKYHVHWEYLAGVNQWQWDQVSKKMKYGHAKKNGTLFIITPHPTYPGIKKTDFQTVGKFAKEHLVNKENAQYV